MFRRPFFALWVLAFALFGSAPSAVAEDILDPRDVRTRGLLEEGVSALTAGELPRADLLLTSAVSEARESGHRGLLFGALTHLAGVRVEQGRFPEGLALMTEAIPVADALAEGGDSAPPELGVTVRLQLTRLLSTRSAHADAEAMGWDTLSVAARVGLLEVALPVVQEIVAAAVRQGDTDDALVLRAVEMDELLAGVAGYAEAHGGESGDVAVAIALSTYGRALSRERALEDAALYFEAALRLHDAAGREEGVGEACRDRAWVALQLDDRARAVSMLRACPGPRAATNLEEWALRRGAPEELGPVPDGEGYERAVRMGRAAEAASAQGRFEVAARGHGDAADAFETAGREAEALAERVARGVALLRAGDMMEAGVAFDAAIAGGTQEGRPLHPDAHIRALLGRSVVRLGRGSHEAARADIAAAGEALFELRRSLGVAATAAELAALRLASGDSDGALEAYERAVDFEAEVGLVHDGRWGLEGLGSVRSAMGDREGAIEAWSGSLDRAERWARGRLIPEMLRGEDQDRRLGEPLPEPLFAPPTLDGPRRLVALLVEDGRIEDAFLASERVRATLWRTVLQEDPDPRLAVPRDATEESLLRIREQVDSLRDRRRMLAFGSTGDAEAQRRELGNLYSVYDVRRQDLLDELSAPAARDLGGVVPPIDAVRTALGDRVLVSLFVSGDRVVRFRLDRGGLTADFVLRSERPERTLLAGLDLDGRRVVLALDGPLSSLPLMRLKTGRKRLREALEGLAVVPAAAALVFPAAAPSGAAVDACRFDDSRPLGVVLMEAPKTSVIDALTVAASLDGIAVAAGAALPGELSCSVIAEGPAAPELGPGSALEAGPLQARVGDAWVALTELAVRFADGALADAGTLSEAEWSKVRRAYAAARDAGAPPDVAVLEAARVTKKAATLRWMGPVGGP